LKKIFLTGASGKLGSYLYPILNNNFKVYGVGKKTNLKHINKLNLLNNSNLKKRLNKLKPDIIIHLAAITDVDLCEKNTNLAYKTNILVTNNLVNWCLKNKKKVQFIYISSDQVYNHKVLNRENDTLNPLNFYAFSKIASENIVSKLKNSLVLRTNFFGFFFNKNGSLIDWYLRMLRLNKRINLIKDITFNPLYVETLCSIINKIILKKDIRGIYNLGTRNKVSKGMLLYKLTKKIGASTHLLKFVKTNQINLFAIRPKNMFMSVDKIEKKLRVKMPNIDYEINLLKDKLIKENAI